MRVAPLKSIVSSDILSKVDIRVGTIELVNDVPGSRKLVRLVVDFGDHKRRVLVGMQREHPNPKEIEGKQALFVVNLEPRKMMGEISEGMLLDIGYADESSLSLLSRKSRFQTERAPDNQSLTDANREVASERKPIVLRANEFGAG
jgi:tRNA-binding protein